MKARNLTALAVVATGAIALGAPTAFAQAPDTSGVDGGLSKLNAIGKSAKKQARDAKKKSSFQKRTDDDIKRLGNNVADLRRKDDEITSTISSVVSTVTPILTQLGAAAQSYADFQYGVVQLSYASNAPAALTAATVPFAETSRLDPTSQQSSVTANFKVPVTFAGGTGAVTAKVAVRSLKDPKVADNESTAYCRITVSQPSDATKFRTSLPNANAKSLPFYPIQRSPLKPTDSSEELTSLVGLTADDQKTAQNLLGATNSWDGNGAADPPNLGTFNATAGAPISVTLSCTRIDNATLKSNGVTPPFAS